MRFFRRAKRPVKFAFTITIDEIMVEGSNRWQPRRLSVKLSRKKRNYSIEPKAWEPTLRNPYRGIAFWSQGAPIEFIVTLYKNSIDAFEEKQWKLSVFDNEQDGRLKKIANLGLDLSLHTTSSVTLERLPLKTLQPASSSTITFSIHPKPLIKSTTNTQITLNGSASPKTNLLQGSLLFEDGDNNNDDNDNDNDASKNGLPNETLFDATINDPLCISDKPHSLEIKLENNKTTSDGLDTIIKDLKLESQAAKDIHDQAYSSNKSISSSTEVEEERKDNIYDIKDVNHDTVKDEANDQSVDRKSTILSTITNSSNASENENKKETPEEARALAIREKARKLIADARRGEMPKPSRGSVSAHSTPKRSQISQNRGNKHASVSSFETARQNSIEIYDYSYTVDDDEVEDRLDAFRRNSVVTRSARMRRFRFYQFRRVHDDTQATENFFKSPNAYQAQKTASNDAISSLTNNNNNSEQINGLQLSANRLDSGSKNDISDSNRLISTIDHFESCDSNQSMLIPREDVIKGKLPIGRKDSCVVDELKNLEEEEKKIEERTAMLKNQFMELTNKNGGFKVVEPNTAGNILSVFGLPSKLAETIGAHLDINCSDEASSNQVNPDAENKQKELMGELCELVNKKNDVIRRQMQLNIIAKEEMLEKTFEQLDKELRSMMLIDESKKTECQRQREKYLLDELVALVEKRNELVHDLDAQEQAIEEDKNLRESLRVKLGEMTDDQNCCIQ